jgi:hypothetical protein
MGEVYFYASSGRVPAEFSVVGLVVPEVVDILSVVLGIFCIEVERLRVMFGRLVRALYVP